MQYQIFVPLLRFPDNYFSPVPKKKLVIFDA